MATTNNRLLGASRHDPRSELRTEESHGDLVNCPKSAIHDAVTTYHL